MEIMYHRKTGKRYEVHSFDVEHDVALCFDPDQAAHSNGQGWCKVSIKRLVPEAYANKVTGEFISKTERNKIKQELTMVAATFQCTDGTLFDVSQMDEAIEHQKKLMEDAAVAQW